MTRKSQGTRRGKSSQRRMLPYIQRSESIQESSLRNTEGKEAVQSNLPGEENLGSKRERCHPPLRYLYEVHRRRQMTTLPLQLEMKIQPLRGILVKSSSGGHASTAALLSIDASPAITPHAPRLEASRRSRITVSVTSGLRLGFAVQTKKPST